VAEFTRIPNKFAVSGMDLHHPPDLLPPGKCSLLFNLSPDPLNGALAMRAPIAALLTAGGGPVHSIVRLNDSVPEAVTAFARFSGAGTSLYRNGILLDSGFSGNPLSLVPYRPPQSPESWLYVYDSLRQQRYKTNGVGQNIGIRAPASEPGISYLQPLYDIVDNATAAWSVFGSPTGGVISAPGTVVRVTASTTILAILYDSGSTGMACIAPTNSGASYAWMTPGSMVILGSEPVVIEKVFAGSYSTTIAAIQYDYMSASGNVSTVGTAVTWVTGNQFDTTWPAGFTIVINAVSYLIASVNSITSITLTSTAGTQVNVAYSVSLQGACTIVPAVPLPGLAKDMLLNLNSGTYVKVTSVTEGPDGSYSFRVNTKLVVITATQTIVGPPSFRAWTTITHAAAATITGNSINATYTPTATGGSMSGIIEATPGTTNLSFASTRPLQNEDYMHVSVAVDQPSFVTEIHILLDVDATTNDFAHNYYYYVLRQGDFQLSSVGGTTTLQDQLSAISNTIAGQLINEEFVDAGPAQPGYPVLEVPATSPPAAVSLQLGQLAWLESMFKLSDLTRVGNDQTRTLANVVKIGIQVYTSGGVVNLYIGGWWAGGGYGPDCNFNSYGNQAPPIQWRYRYRNSLTGSRSTVSPETRNGEILRRQGVNITAPSSSDTQVDTVDFERRGGTNPDWHYVGSLPQGVSTTVFLDNVTENAAQAGDPLEITCYQPWPVTDIPHTGTVLVIGTSVLWQSGDMFNVRWLRGTEIILGGNTYSLFAPPASPLFLQLAQCVPPPSGVYSFQIPEATIEGNPLYAAWLDEGSNRVLSVGDPLNPGLMYFSNNDNPDGASDSGYLEVTSPNEPLLNGCYAEGSNWVFSASSIFRVDPTPGAVNPYAAFRVSGIEGLAAPWAFNVISKLLYYWGPDGIYEYGFGNESKNITSDDLFPLFPNQGQAGQAGIPGVPVSIAGQTIYPPSYTFPNFLRIGYSENFVYATYQNSTGAIEALVYSLAAKGWRKDTYTPAATLFVLETGVPNPTLMVGATDGNLYQTSSAVGQDAGGPVNWAFLPKLLDAGDSRAVKQWGDSMLDSQGTVSVQVLWDNLLINGPFTVISSLNRAHTLLDLFAPPDTNDTPLIHFNATVLLTGQDGAYLYEWQPSFTSIPEITTSRVTGWEGSGGLHYKFVQGIRLHFNTFGLPKQIEVQYDGYQIGTTLTVNADGQQTIPYSFPVPFKAHMMRLVPLDDVPWEVWSDSEWIFEPEPEPGNYWISQPTSLGQSGFLHCRELWPAWAGSGIVSVIVDGRTPITLATLALSASPVKSYFPCPPLKGKYWQLTATGTGLQLYERDIEFLVKSWGSTGPYARVRPFGDLSGGGGQTGARI
jgi:hypothetical protein